MRKLWSSEGKFNKNKFFLIPSLVVNLSGDWQDVFVRANDLKCLTLYPSKDELNILRKISRRNKQSISVAVRKAVDGYLQKKELGSKHTSSACPKEEILQPVKYLPTWIANQQIKVSIHSNESFCYRFSNWGDKQVLQLDISFMLWSQFDIWVWASKTLGRNLGLALQVNTKVINLSHPPNSSNSLFCSPILTCNVAIFHQIKSNHTTLSPICQANQNPSKQAF